MKMTARYMSDLARWAEEHKDEITPFLPVDEPGWIDQCKYYRFPVAKSRGTINERESMRGDFFDEAMQYHDIDIAAQNAAEKALHISQHSNGAEPVEICPECNGTDKLPMERGGTPESA